MRGARLFGAVVLGALAVTPAPSPAAATARGVGPILRELVLTAQGPTIAVKGTPAQCGDQGPDVGTAPWYFGEGACALEYRPNANSLVTSISLGELKTVFSVEVARRIQGLLDELGVAVRSANLDLQDKLLAQSTVWELVHGIERAGERDAAFSARNEALLCQAARLLRATAFRPEEAGRLPANLGDLPRLAGAPQIEDLARRLVAHDPGIVEVVPSSDLHADLLFGRFTARVFLTAAGPAERENLRAFVSDAKTPYGALRSLPQSFEGVEGVLLLFFNVLTEDQTVLLTPEVAVWQQYTFDAKVSIDTPFADAARHIRFLSVEYQKDADRPSRVPRYRLIAQDEMASQGLLNVKPFRAGAWVTSARGQCLKCHVHQVATFDTHGRRLVAFAPPLLRPAADVVTPYYRANVEARLRKRLAQCEASKAGAGVAP